jgi:hypothetical protein
MQTDKFPTVASYEYFAHWITEAVPSYYDIAASDVYQHKMTMKMNSMRSFTDAPVRKRKPHKILVVNQRGQGDDYVITRHDITRHVMPSIDRIMGAAVSLGVSGQLEYIYIGGISVMSLAHQAGRVCNAHKLLPRDKSILTNTLDNFYAEALLYHCKVTILTCGNRVVWVVGNADTAIAYAVDVFCAHDIADIPNVLRYVDVVPYRGGPECSITRGSYDLWGMKESLNRKQFLFMTISGYIHPYWLSYRLPGTGGVSRYGTLYDITYDEIDYDETVQRLVPVSPSYPGMRQDLERAIEAMGCVIPDPLGLE